MTDRVRWDPEAAADIERLARRDRRQAQRIRERIARFAQTGTGDVTKLSGKADEWRLRVGDWRVRFRFDRDAQVIVVLGVLLRSERTYRD